MKFLYSIDCNHLELLNQRWQNLATAPSSPQEGWVYYNSADHKFYGWNNSSWVDLGTSGGGGSGTVTGISIASSNGFAGSSDGNSATPTLTISTTITGLLKGNGTAISVAGAADIPTLTSAKISDFDTQVRTSRLDQMAAPTASVNLNSQKITGLANGTANDDAVNFGQLSSIAQGFSFKDPVRVVATANGTLASAYANGQTVDGVTLATGNRILLAGQTTASDNGLYTVNASGAPTRATDADANGEIKDGTFVPIQEGTANANAVYYCSATGATPWVPGSSTSTWAKLPTLTDLVAGNGLTKTGNTLDVGAGTGITVAADSVAIDTTVVARKYAATIGDGSATSIAVTHNLGSKDVVVSFRDASTDAAVVADWTATSTNVVTANFATAPASNAIRVAVIG